MPLYEYHCPDCGCQEERIEPKTVLDLPCLMCDGTMHRRFPYRIHFGNSPQTYHRRTQTLAEKFRKHPRQLAILRENARRRGITISPEDAYHDCLAKHPLDPEAVVPHDDPLGYIKRLSERRGDPVEGMVNVKGVAREPKPTSGPNLSDRAIYSIMYQKVHENPDLRHNRVALKKLREDVINKHAPKQLVGET